MRTLAVVTYHYIRDSAGTEFPGIKGLTVDQFRGQVAGLRTRYEMATLESALSFLRGDYHPRRDLCLLTFDDGLKEHSRVAALLLAEARIQGIFFVVSSCAEEHRVAPVHMNHFLTAKLGFAAYAAAFEERLSARDRARCAADRHQDACARTYPWDESPVARFKYLFNFLLDPAVRDPIVRELFRERIGGEEPFARELYAGWEELQGMQSAGMLIGGHSQSHRPLALLSPAELKQDLENCRRLLDCRLRPQPLWPFSYPYGKRESYTRAAIEKLIELGFHCGFSTESEENRPGVPLFSIGRTDCKVLCGGENACRIPA